MAEEISRRWNLKQQETSDPFVLSPIVDPRFKLIQSLSEGDKVCIKANIIEQINSFCMPAITYSGSKDEAEPMEMAEVSEPVQKKVKRLTALDKLLGPEHEEEGLTFEAELEQYLNEKLIKRTTKPLTWWKNNDRRFPKLAKVARSLLNIPSTSTPSERIFSIGGLSMLCTIAVWHMYLPTTCEPVGQI